MSIYKEEIFGKEDYCPYCGHYDNDINEYSDDDDIVKINGVTYYRNYMMCSDCGEYYIWFEPIEDNLRPLEASVKYHLNSEEKIEIKTMADDILNRISIMELDAESKIELIQAVSNYFSEVYGNKIKKYRSTGRF